MFAKRGIPPELLAQARVERVTDREARDKYGIRFDRTKDCSGIVFPYYSPVNGNRVTARLRRDLPEIDRNGKPQNKYLSPYGDNRHLFFPPGAAELLADRETVIVLVESEKAALALTAWSKRTGREVLAVAMGGCWSWRSRRARSVEMPNGSWERVPGPVDDLNLCNGHPVVIMLDSNWRFEINPKVYWARTELSVEMSKPERGCSVLLCDLPLEEGVNGPDDYIATHGDAAMAEIFAQAHSPAYKSAQEQAEAETAEYSDDALALKFTGKHKDQLRYVDQWGRWLIWTGRVWTPDTTLRVFDLIREVCRAESASAKPNNLLLARKIVSATTVAAVERLARADRRHAATVEQWDADPWLLNTPGGVVDLRTGEIRPPRREDYMTKITAAAPGGKCPRWMKFLKRITSGDKELSAYLQRVCGYCLTGVTREHAMFFLSGTGANGKSTFVDTFAGMLGDYARTAPIEIFLDSNHERHPTELAWLQGERFVSAVETEEGRRWSESKLKQLTGGDPIAARFMRQDFFEFTPQFKLAIQGNHKPGLRTVDEAIRRRFNLLPFTVTIPELERDKKLKDKLHKEWSGILEWAIRGALAWQREGLNPPDAVKNATADYLAQEDAVGRWLEDCCELQANAWEITSELWASYRRWAELNGEFTGTERAFSQSLESRGLKRGRTNAARTFRGVSLRRVGPVTDVTGPPYIDATRAHAHERPNKEDLSHPSLEPHGRSNPRTQSSIDNESAISAADVPVIDQTAAESAPDDGPFIDVEV